MIARIATVALRIEDIELDRSGFLHFYMHSHALEIAVKEAREKTRRSHLLFLRVAWNARRNNPFFASVLHLGQERES